MFNKSITTLIVLVIVTASIQEKIQQKIRNRVYYEKLEVLPKHAFKDYPPPTSWEVNIIIEGTNLTTIEPEAFLNVKIHSIDIVHNDLGALTKGMFVNISVRLFFLNDNNITAVEPGTFDTIHPYDRHGSIMLSLHGNLLESIKRGIFNNLKLNTLYLQNNQIKFVEKGAFNNISGLKHLDLSNNLLETIGVGIFKNLGDSLYLKLTKNKIKFVNPKAFEYNTNMQLHLNANELNITKEYFSNAVDIVKIVI